MKKINSLCLMITLGLLAEGQVMAAPDWNRGMDAGAQMERDRRDMEREQVREQIAEDEAAKKNKVETAEVSPADDTDAKLHFELKQVTWNPSEILTAEAIHAVVDGYVGRQITLKDLREMANRITELYKERGYMTCGAVLPPQRIHDGVVEIRLIEGKTGEITIQGNRYTKDKYITDRLGLKPGEIANIDKLNRSLRWFHGTNDLQLRVILKPGTNENTTDYEIIAFEPKNDSVTLYIDNDGYKSNGRWREGLFYNMRSLSKYRDALRSSFLRSQGTKAWSLGYSVPVSSTGMRLDVNYAGNSTKVTNGELKKLGVEGKSSSFSLTWRVPFRMTEHSRHETGLQYVYQKAETELGHGTGLVVPWLEDRIQRISPYVSFTHYGNSAVLYHKHSFVQAKRKDIDGGSDTARLYRLSSFWQKRCKDGQFWQGRLDGQWASNSYLASSDRIFLGGVNSVRGYEEGFIGGERGLSAGIEYHIPLDKERRFFAFPFFDWGTVAGDTAPEHHTLMSMGWGLTARYKNIYSSLTMGFPLKKDFYDNHLSSTRVDFSLSATF
ncbi:Hemolysin activation/secretion protein [Selenomonas sp. WCT3]|uniref:ShlB/FhaC/HecB family hemolysin secretion/activation protein n=1 Tax=Selenomonas sp. WCT3 TaxID=3158785 RepID=UPI000883F24E|nr:Hemolysin activation/secretion protein [Selenomonas ruminantium]